MNATPLPPRQFAPWLLGVLAAALAFLCLWLAGLYLQARAENAVLRDAQALTALELRAARNQLEAERILAAARERAARDSTPPGPPRRPEN